MKKILTVVGARPQFVKAAALSRELKKHDRFREVLVHTGQHYDDNMSDVFFREMEIPAPAYHLGIHGLTHGAMTGQMMEAVEKVLVKERPDLVLVYGDTNSTLAGALAAVKLHLPVAHVEAGLRSFNLKMPEEINRIVADRLSRLLFCPTETAVRNLEHEGFRHFPCRIVRSGDVMFDAALYYSRTSEQRSTLVRKLALPAFALATLHRSENTDDPVRLKSIVSALNRLNKSVPVVLPLHPRTRKALHAAGLEFRGRLTDPVGYFDMLELLKHCRLVLTDSGGLQKEAFFFQRHCVTLRNETEWTELVDGGFNVLAGADEEAIFLAAGDMMKKDSDFSVNLFGRGDASALIAGALLEFFNA